jgi:hypothetical protein
MIKIEFSEDYNIPVIRAALVESYMGYAGDVLPDLLGTTKDKLESLHKDFKQQTEQNSLSVTLSLDDWKVLYHTINIVVHELGPEDLLTMTGCFGIEFLNTARAIYLKIFDRKGTLYWTKDNIHE